MFTEKDEYKAKDFMNECLNYLGGHAPFRNSMDEQMKVYEFFMLKLAQLENQIEELKNKDGN